MKTIWKLHYALVLGALLLSSRPAAAQNAGPMSDFQDRDPLEYSGPYDFNNITITASGVDFTATISAPSIERDFAAQVLNNAGSGVFTWTITEIATNAVVELGPTGTFEITGQDITWSHVKVKYHPIRVECVMAPAFNYNLSVSRNISGGIPAHMSVTPMGLRACADDPAISSPQGIDMIMVVDVSGSMGDPAVCQCLQPPPSGSQCSPGPSTNLSKLEYVKSKMMSAYNALGDLMRTQDRFGLVTFETTAVPKIQLGSFNQGMRNNLETYTITFDNMTTTPNALRPLGSTALGSGLREAVNMFNAASAGRKKVIVLLTNGVQNEPPLVKKDAAGVYIDSSPRIALNDIEIIPYAIFTPEGAFYDLLKDLGRTGRSSSTTTQSSPYVCDVGRALSANWVEAVSSIGSPKMIDYRGNRLSGTSGQESFTVTEAMSHLTLNISAVGNYNFTAFKVEKMVGGVATDITGYGSIVPPLSQVSSHRAFHVAFPLAIPGGFTTEGEYRLSFTSDQPDLYYENAVIVDDKGLKQGYFTSELLPAGEELYLGAYLYQDADPVTNANMEAIIYQPKKALGNRFAAKKVPGKFIRVKGPWGRLFPVKHSDLAVSGGNIYQSGYSPEGAYTKQITITHPTLSSFKGLEGNNVQLGEKKYLVLLNETDFKDNYDLDIVATVPLKHVANGVYRAGYKNLNKAGLYKIRFIAKGSTPIVGTFTRFADRTTVVRFGTPDLRHSQLFALYESPFIISMKPVDTEGNLLGPNQVSAIRIELSAGTAGTPEDYLDGRYLVRLNVPGSGDPRLTIRIHDRILYDGPLSGLSKKRGFLAIDAGLSIPKGTFDTKYDPGFFIDGKVGFRVYQQFGLQLKGGYYAFKDVATNQTDHSIGAIGLGLNYRQWLGMDFLTGIFLQAEVNAGYYKRQGAEGCLGVNAGGALVKPLSHFFNVLAEVDYHRLYSKPVTTDFLTLGLGVQVRF